MLIVPVIQYYEKIGRVISVQAKRRKMLTRFNVLKQSIAGGIIK